MTYIIGGNFKGEKFICVDSIVDNDGKKPKTEKIKKSSVLKNTYFSMTGNALLMDVVLLYDEYCNKRGIDYQIDEDFLDTIINEYKVVCEKYDVEDFGLNKVYVLNDDVLWSISIMFNGKILCIKDIQIVKEGQYMLNFGKPEEISSMGCSLEDFCLSKMYGFYSKEVNSDGFDSTYFKGNNSFISSKDGVRYNTHIMDSFRNYVESHCQ